MAQRQGCNQAIAAVTFGGCAGAGATSRAHVDRPQHLDRGHVRACLAEVGSLCVTSGAHDARWSAVSAALPPVDVVDTTGAGDSVVGILAAAIVRGAPEDEALTQVVHAGSRTCTTRGAQEWNLARSEQPPT